jgi:lipoprotein NlpI
MRFCICTVVLFATCPLFAAGQANDSVRKARAALRKGDAAAALEAAQKAVEADPKSAEAIDLRGQAYSAQRKHTEALKDFDAALALDSSYLLAQNHRGAARFKLGMIQESLDDFNAYLKVYPKEEPGHWQRGISFYYAGKYTEGAKQFFDGRVVFDDDVENAFWHFLCNARKDGVDRARKYLLALEGVDNRVPMMRVYDMLQGKAKPAEVIETAEKANLEGEARTEALFYAHLYVALYYEAAGDADKCKETLTPAVEKYQIGHYMWDVANIHLARMKKK